MQLMGRTLNALRIYAQDVLGWEPSTDAEHRAGPPKTLIATLTYDDARKIPEVGKLGLADIVKWLAEDGETLRGMPEPECRPTVSQARLDAARNVLEAHGYTVSGKPRAWTVAEKCDLLRRHLAGESYAQIGRDLRLSRAHVANLVGHAQRYVEKNGWPIDNGGGIGYTCKS